MYSFTFAAKVSDLMDRQLADMNDDELSLWLVTCEILERRINPERAERNWHAAKLEAQAEIDRRRVISKPR